MQSVMPLDSRRVLRVFCVFFFFFFLFVFSLPLIYIYLFIGVFFNNFYLFNSVFNINSETSALDHLLKAYNLRLLCKVCFSGSRALIIYSL